MKRKQTIVIEVEGGCVRGVYCDGPCFYFPLVKVVDLDGAKVGEATRVEEIKAHPLEQASDVVLDALEDHRQATAWYAK